jgi:hypothetical protein
LTILPRTQRAAQLAANGVCGKANSQTPAQTAGQGSKAAGISTEESSKDERTQQLNAEKEQAQKLLDGEVCKKCEQCVPPPPPDAPVPPNNVGAEPHPGHPNMRRYRNGFIPFDKMVGVERSVDRCLKRYTYKGEPHWFLLEPEAAAQYIKFREFAQSQGVKWSLTSAYREFDHQDAINKRNIQNNGGRGDGTVAKPGSSPHGWGAAVDILELFNAANRGSGNHEVNRRVREGTSDASRLYRWMQTNGPKFGFYNPKRMADMQGTVDECWHFEYWGFIPNLRPTGATNTPTPTPPSTTKPPRFSAIFVSGLTSSLSAAGQTAAFRQPLGPNRSLFSAEYTQVQSVRSILAQHPKTPVYLYSRAAGPDVLNALMNDPNVDKQKLFLIEPYFGENGDATRNAVLRAISNGLPVANVFAGPIPNRGGGNRIIPGSSLVPPVNTHFQAPTYVAGVTLPVMPVTTPFPATGATTVPAPTSTPVPTQPIQNSQVPANTGCTDQQYLNISIADNPLGLAIGTSVQDGKDLCKKCERAKQTVNQTTQIMQEEEKIKEKIEKKLRDFPHLQAIFRYIEMFPEYMVAEITDTANGNFANAFGASPGALSIGGDLVLPGISGLRVGELFWIDRLPSFYKVFGAFQILSIEDVIDVSGWKTKIHARFNFLGNNWKTAIAEKFRRETNNARTQSG